MINLQEVSSWVSTFFSFLLPPPLQFFLIISDESGPCLVWPLVPDLSLFRAAVFSEDTFHEEFCNKHTSVWGRETVVIQKIIALGSRRAKSVIWLCFWAWPWTRPDPLWDLDFSSLRQGSCFRNLFFKLFYFPLLTFHLFEGCFVTNRSIFGLYITNIYPHLCIWQFQELALVLLKFGTTQ